MKRRIGKNVATACVAGLMLGAVGAVAPDVAMADTSTSGGLTAEQASQNENVALYGPPSIFEGDDPILIDEPIQDLYGPPIDAPIEVLYGPPPSDDIVVDPVDDSTAKAVDNTGKESGSIAVDEPITTLYGPPSVFLLKDNPMKVRAYDRAVKAKRVRAKKWVFKKGIVVKKPVGKVRYKRVAKGSAKQLRVNKDNGWITLAKGTKKGDYEVKVMVTAAGNDKFRSAAKTVTVKVHVK